MADSLETLEQGQPESAGTVSARRDLASHLRLWPVAVVALAADLWTKHWAFTHLDPNPAGQAWEIIPQVMSFRRSLNTGALFGLGKGLTPVFIAASLVALLFVLFLFIHSTRDRRSLHVALGLVLAGALGNLYDRAFMIADVVRYRVEGRTYVEACKVLDQREDAVVIGVWPEGGGEPRVISSRYEPRITQQGVVRDFIKMEPRFRVGGYTIEIWPWVFNIADVLLVVGVGLLLLNFWWDRKAEKAAERAKERSPA